MPRAFFAVLFAVSAYIGVILVGSQLDLPRTTADTSLKPRTELLAAAGGTTFLDFLGQVVSELSLANLILSPPRVRNLRRYSPSP